MKPLRHLSALLLAVTLALAAAFVAAPTPLLAAAVAQASGPSIQGYYESNVIPGEGDTPDLVVGLLLNEDGSAKVISNYQNENEDVIIEVGAWVDNGDGTVTLTVTGTTTDVYAAPIPLDFNVETDGALVVPGDPNGAFGEDGLNLVPTPLGNNDLILAQIPENALVYQSGIMDSPTGPGLQLTLALLGDGSLLLASDYLQPDKVVVEVGTWSEGDDGSLVITLTGQLEAGAVTEYEAPLEFTFTPNDDDSLALVDEGGALFGEAGLTLLPIDASGTSGITGSEGITGTEEISATEGITESAEITDSGEINESEALTETAEVTESEEVTETGAVTESEEVSETDAITEETPLAEETPEAGAEEVITGENGVTATVALTPTGAYVSAMLPADAGSGTFVLAIFNDDNTLIFTTYTINGNLPLVELGSWDDNGDGNYSITVTGTVDAPYDAPVTVDFTLEEGAVNISGVLLYPLADLDLAGAPTLVAEFQSGPITNTVDVSHTLTLVVYDDFSAQLVTDYEGDADDTTEYGIWTMDEATDQLTVTISRNDDGEYDEPVEWIFDVTNDDSLVLANDDEGYYGEDGLTLLPLEVDEEELNEESTGPNTGGGASEVGAPAANTDEEAADQTSGDEDTTGEDATAEEGSVVTTTTNVQIFQSEVLPAASSPGLQLTLGLQDDGSAAIDYDYMNGEEVITNTGQWVGNDDATITISFTDGPNGPLDLPVELTLELDDDGNLVITDASEESSGLIDVVLAPVALE